MPRSAIPLLLLLLPTFLSAAEIRVPTDQPSLGAALAVAAASDTITLGALTLSEHDLTIPAGLDGLLIRGSDGDPTEAVLDASGGTHALTNLASAVTLRDFTIQGAAGTGVVATGAANLFLLGCVIENCGAGGAVVDDVEAVGCVFQGNDSADSTRAGGLTAVTAVVTDCTFDGNDGVQGGALRVVSDRLSLEGCTFTGNRASEDGGAIYLENAFYLIANTTFDDNQASVAGGALYVENGDALGSHDVVDTWFLGNKANLLGGAVHVRTLPGGKSADFTRVIFSGHGIIGSGGALSIRECAATVSGATFTGNAASQGGAIHVADGTLDLSASLLAFNTGGAAVICEGVSTATASCSDIFGNSGGDWIGCLSGQNGTSDNLSVDPEFCSSQPDVDRNWELQSDSPCLPAAASCSQIGALGAGCDLVPVERTTWGSLKRRFGN